MKRVINIVIKGWYEKPEFTNRYTIEWPHPWLPSIGHYVDIKEFLSNPDNRMNETYRVDMVQWGREDVSICLVPIK